jgi:hypothetical protein
MGTTPVYPELSKLYKVNHSKKCDSLFQVCKLPLEQTHLNNIGTFETAFRSSQTFNKAFHKAYFHLEGSYGATTHTIMSLSIKTLSTRGLILTHQYGTVTR